MAFDGMWEYLKSRFPALGRYKSAYENSGVYKEWFRRSRDHSNHSYSQRAAMRRRLRAVTGTRRNWQDPFLEAAWYELKESNEEVEDNPGYYRDMLGVVLDTDGDFSKEERDFARRELSVVGGYDAWEANQPWIDYKE